MATRRVRKESGIQRFANDDLYGRLSIPGSATLINDRRMRRIAKGRNNFLHRSKNGINDPFTFFHLVEALLGMEPGERFTASQFAWWLNKERPTFIWDAVTVGRILHDINESFRDIVAGDAHMPLITYREWSGVYYETTSYPVARVNLVNLVEDLFRICEKLQETEATGDLPRRVQTPLLDCPSLIDPARILAENLEEVAA